MRQGDLIEVELTRINAGEGIGFLDNGATVIISGISKSDSVVKCRIDEIGERTIFASKVEGINKEDIEETTEINDDPYDVEEETSDEDNY